jgi:3-dehydroquinate synthase
VRTVRVCFDRGSYPVRVGGGLLREAGNILANAGFAAPPVLVTNPRVWRLHGSALLSGLEPTFGKIHRVVIGDGERFKNHATLSLIYDGLFRARADRHSWILAFGGGVVGDVAGFAAATFMRGIAFVNVPTTLLAQVDSSIGGKVGINVPQGKNLVGAFHQPSAVLSDTSVLRTLVPRELAAGLYEVVKSGAIRSEPLVRYLETTLPQILGGDPECLERAVVAASRIKAHVVAADEREKGLRMILNFGHTLGHALEAATDYRRFKHGEAVAWGMAAALGFGVETGVTDPGDSHRLATLIHRVEKLPGLGGIEFDDLWTSLERDKKFRSGRLRIVLIRRVGEAEICADVDRRGLRRYLKQFVRRPGGVEA